MARALTLLAATAAGLALVAAALTGCADGDDTDAAPPTTDPALAAADAVVAVEDNDFGPENVEVGVGDTVGWHWNGHNDHNVVFDDGPASPIQDDGTWTQTFDEPGTYPYVCTLHSSMAGTVTVTN